MVSQRRSITVSMISKITEITFANMAPPDRDTVIHHSYSSNGPASGSGGLRHGERRLLEQEGVTTDGR